MKKLKMWLWIMAAGIFFMRPLSAKAEEITVELTVEYEDTTFNGIETEGEYGIICGKNSSGEVLWEVNTKTYPMTQYDAVTEIGQKNGLYYYEEGGTLKALNVKNGKRKWKVSGCGAISDFTFDSNGTLFFCSSEGPDFTEVDRNGRVLKRIEHLDEKVYWPYQIECLEDNQIAITFEGAEEEYDKYREDGTGGIVFLIDRKDGSCYPRKTGRFREFYVDGYYPEDNQMDGTPVKYAYIDLEGDGQKELLIYTENKDNLYLWKQHENDYMCVLEYGMLMNEDIQEMEILFSPEYKQLVVHAKDNSTEAYCFDMIYGRWWETEFAIYRTEEENGSKSIYFEDMIMEEVHKLAEYKEENSRERKNALAIWESYTGNLEKIEFKDLPHEK